MEAEPEQAPDLNEQWDLIAKTLADSHNAEVNQIGYSFATLLAIHRARELDQQHPSASLERRFIKATASEFARDVVRRALLRSGHPELFDAYAEAVGGLPFQPEDPNMGT